MIIETSATVYGFMGQESAEGGGYRVRATKTNSLGGDLLHAIDGDGRPTLLVPLTDADFIPIPWETQSLQFDTRTLTLRGDNTSFAILKCTDSRLYRQFFLLVDDVLQAVSGDSGDAVRRLVTTVESWKSLFERPMNSMLGPAQLAGLWGELEFLRTSFSEMGPGAIEAWVGPSGARHDFVFDELAVEVKTTTSLESMVVGIHGTHQLEAPHGSRLYMIVYQVERQRAGRSVPELIEKLVTEGIPRVQLLEQLSNIGYYHSDADNYEKDRFRTIQSKTVEIDAEFPRITPETVSPASFLEYIHHVQYSVDLSRFKSTDIPPLVITQYGESDSAL